MAHKNWLKFAALTLAFLAPCANAADRALLGVLIGGPMGAGLYFSGAVGPKLALGLYGATYKTDLRGDDRLKINRVGLRGRWHWSGSAPVGGYLFVDLAQVNAQFQKSAAEVGRVSSDLDDGFKTAVGVGYQTRSHNFSFDVGGGFGSKETYKAGYFGGDGRGEAMQESAGMLYVGFSFGL